MHPQLLTLIAAQRIADLHRAADNDRVVHTATTATSSHATTATSSHAVPAPRPAAARIRLEIASEQAARPCVRHGPDSRLPDGDCGVVGTGPPSRF
jgi:hypothetical protein